MEVIYSSAITAIGMLITSYISYRVSISSKKLDIEKLKIEIENQNKKLELEEKTKLFSDYLSQTSKAFYLTTPENLDKYLTAYRKFTLVCPDSVINVSSKIHAMILNSTMVINYAIQKKQYDPEFESIMNDLSKLLQEDIQQSKHKP